MSASELERALGSAEELVLETRGRRSGGRHHVTLWFAYEDGAVWLRADVDADWHRNLRTDPRCRVSVGDAGSDAVREDVADEPAALRHVVALWRAKYGNEWVGDWYVERGRVPVRVRILPPD